jgi:hypothetical protein
MSALPLISHRLFAAAVGPFKLKVRPVKERPVVITVDNAKLTPVQENESYQHLPRLTAPESFQVNASAT